MNVLRAIVASLLSLVCTLSASAFITLATLQTTLLNRQEVKGWLQTSGVYGNAVSTAFATNPIIQDQATNIAAVIPQDSLKSALNQTITPNFVQQQSEKLIDSTYDWLEGKQPFISLNVTTTQLKDTFVQNTAAAIEPQLAQLPVCSSAAQFSANDPTCIPRGTSAQQLAQSLATDAGNQLSLFQQPLTNDSLAKANSETGQNDNDSPLTSPHSSAQPLQQVTANLKQWLLWLSIIAIVSGALSIVLSRDRLKAGKYLARRLTFGLLITFLVGLIVANVGKNIKLSSFVSGNNTVLANIIDPIVHQAAPAIGNRLALISSIAGGITLVLWIMFQTLWENKERTKLVSDAKTDDKPSASVINQHAESPTAEPTSGKTAHSIPVQSDSSEDQNVPTKRS